MTMPEQLPAILAIVALAGLTQGLAGFGSALIAVPLLALVLPMATLVPLMVMLGTLVSAMNLAHLHHAVGGAPILRLLLGYLVGIPVGLLFLTRAPEPLVLGLLGLFLVGFAGLSLANRQPRSAWLRERRLAVGVLSGALGTAYGTGGPPVVLHVSAHPEWGADRQKAALTLFFVFAGALTTAAQWAGGLMTAEVLRLLAWSTPALMGGTLAGIWLYRRLGEHDYRRLLLLLVMAAGLMLLGRATGLG
jgi:uncharacterized membrane protein YfcA